MQIVVQVLDSSGANIQTLSSDVAGVGSGSFGLSFGGSQSQGLNGPIIPASVLVTSDVPLAVIAQVALRVGGRTFPRFGVVPVDACVGWSYVHTESVDQRSGIALQNSDRGAATSCTLNFFQGLEGLPVGEIQRDIPAGHRIQFFPGDEITGSPEGAGLPEGISAAFIRCDLPVYMAVLNQAPDGAMILNEATCLDSLGQ